MLLKKLLPLAGLLGTSGGLGAIVQSVLTEGAPSNTQFAIGGVSIAALVGLVMKVIGDWKKAGGKLDGVTTEAEAKSVIDSLCDAFGLWPTIKTAAERLAEPAAEISTRIEARVHNSTPGATALLGLMSDYLNEGHDSNHNAVLWKCVDTLSKAIEGNPAGEDLIAKFRDQLDLKLFPGTPAVSGTALAAG
ncbi:MAG: hypothetical protein ACKV2Q_24815 [Planctomycetaceae bacterium]